MKSLSPNRRKYFFVFAFVFLFVVFVLAVFRFFPVNSNAAPGFTWGFGVDWKGYLRPTTLSLLRGESPYTHGIILHPPWTYLLLAPVALFPEALGATIMFALNYFIYGLILYRMKARPLALLLFLSLPLVLLNGYNGNIDWLCLLGIILPQPIGLLFLSIKPQIGTGIAIYWMVEAWRSGGIKKFLCLIAPTALAYIVSFILYGFWPVGMLTGMVKDPFNYSLGQIGIIVGGVMLVMAIRHRKSGLALMSSLFFAPYVNIHSYVVAILGLEANSIEFYAAIGLAWLVAIFWHG